MSPTTPPTAPPAGPEAPVLVGGQALLEGVLMRTPSAYGIAVRKPDGSLALRSGAVDSLGKRFRALRLPVLRGGAVLYQSLALGMSALNFSAAVATGGEEEPASGGGWVAGISTALALLAGAGLFLLLPLWLTQQIERHWLGPLSSLSFNLIDGALRGVFFLAYLVAIARLPDIHRVFMYHGAEHKVVFAQEFGLPLTVENARRQSRLHPRCGTSFLLFVLLLSIVLFALIPRSAPLPVKFGGRLLLLPVLAGLSYEVLRWTARRAGSPLFRALVWPGLMLQKITTQEPTDDMLEVALAALSESWRAEGVPAEASLAPQPQLAAAEA